MAVDVSSMKNLDSYDDRNFYLRATPAGESQPKEYSFKVHNGVDSDAPETIAGQNELLSFVFSKGFFCPCPVKALDGTDMPYTAIKVPDGSSKPMAVRLLTWVPGKIMNDIDFPMSLLYKVRATHPSQHTLTRGPAVPVGRLLRAPLQRPDGLRPRRRAPPQPVGREPDRRRGNVHAAPRRPRAPRAGGAGESLESCRSALARRALTRRGLTRPSLCRCRLSQVIADFQTKVQPRIDQGLIRQGVLMGDFSATNTIVSDSGDDMVGVIDFGDMVFRSERRPFPFRHGLADPPSDTHPPPDTTLFRPACHATLAPTLMRLLLPL
jgi:hypothetical protein